MGSLRLLLALSVAIGHSGALPWLPVVPGDSAVESFFVISGFYMSLVLNGKYASASYFTFFSNRLLRLFPVYVIILVATIFLHPATKPDLDFRGWLFFTASQILLFGQDAYNFLSVDGGHLHFARQFTSLMLFNFAPIPQAWTLGIELAFYTIAPFILRRSLAFLAPALIASLFVRMFFQFVFGLSGDPWSYRFFPSELALFFAGAIAQRLPLNRDSAIKLTMVAVTVAAALFVNRPGGAGRAFSVLFVGGVIVVLPWLFETTRNLTLDAFVGELSYPLYVCHILLIVISPTPLLGLAFSIIVSMALYLLVDRNIDNWRHRRFRRQSSSLQST